MDKGIIKIILISLIIAFPFGLGHGIYTKYLDNQLQKENPEQYLMFKEEGITGSLFSWAGTFFFMLKAFVAVFVILTMVHFIRKKNPPNQT